MTDQIAAFVFIGGWLAVALWICRPLHPQTRFDVRSSRAYSQRMSALRRSVRTWGGYPR